MTQPSTGAQTIDDGANAGSSDQPPAARAVGATKIYGQGEAEVRAIDGIDHGAIGFWEVDAHAVHGWARPPDVGGDLDR
jgi:hypothetical protein